MNIFVLDSDFHKCAIYHCDQHVVKMILESIQILCTVLAKKGFKTPYRPTHRNHPCVLWVEKSYANFRWLKALVIELNEEYRFRFNHCYDHKSISVLKEIEGVIYQDKGLTEFVQAMPEKYKIEGNAVRAYRNYYIGEKSRFARWTKRPIPDWFIIS